MSIRMRMALCYAALFALILALVGVTIYALHARALYDDIDRALVTSAGHSAAEAATSRTGPDLIEGHGGFEVLLARYGPDGSWQQSSEDVSILRTIRPESVLRAPAGPAFDGIAGLVPPIAIPPAPAASAFGLLAMTDQRWRIYVLPFQQQRLLAGYIAAMTPLGQVDASIGDFRVMVLTLELAGLTVALAGGWLVASRALRPCAQMLDTARAIASSRDLSRRIDMPPSRDELGRLAETLNRMLDSLETTHRSQQRFISDASHELRAPLTAIQANLELLRRHTTMAMSEREEALVEAERETHRLSRLVADLLVLARADAGIGLMHKTVELDTVLLDVFRTARQLARGQVLTLEPFEPVTVAGDEDRLKQLVLILLDNALKYTPADGCVTLGVRREGSDAEIVIRDTGVGIAPADLPHVFERFFRTDPAHSRDPGGTGLGLPIARWIVEQHAGDIALTSRPGSGTTATVRLPLLAMALSRSEQRLVHGSQRSPQRTISHTSGYTQ